MHDFALPKLFPRAREGLAGVLPVRPRPSSPAAPTCKKSRRVWPLHNVRGDPSTRSIIHPPTSQRTSLMEDGIRGTQGEARSFASPVDVSRSRAKRYCRLSLRERTLFRGAKGDSSSVQVLTLTP